MSTFFPVPLLVAAAVVCMYDDAAAAENNAHRTGTVLRRTEIDLRPYALSWEENNPQILFSKGGQQICVWWKFGDVKPAYPAKFLVFDLAGNRQGGWSDTNFLERLREFPAISWKWTRSDFVREMPATLDERAVGAQAGPATRAAQSGLHTNTWPRRVSTGATMLFSPIGFNHDLSEGLRSSEIHVAHEFLEVPVRLEMWKLTEPKQRVWSLDLPTGQEAGSGDPRPVGLLHDWTVEPVLVQLGSKWCAEIDPHTGKMKRKFTFGPIQGEKIGGEPSTDLVGDNGSEAFPAFSCAFDPNHGWIACGCTEDRRVRVVGLTAPAVVLFEAHSKASRSQPLGGRWSSGPVQFFAEGSYMVAEYEFERRFGPYRHEVEVYDTSSWGVVWRTTDSKVQSFALSPHGDMMAYIRDASLVIAPFQPNLRDGARLRH